MPSVEPVLVRGSRIDRPTTFVGGLVTVSVIVAGLLFVGLRDPAPPAERMSLLQQPVQRVAAQVPAPVAERPPPRMGRWTPAIGVQIARRAAKWLGWPYTFGGGNGAGPTYGHAVDADSRNDAHVYGFDCSGLMMYALAPWRGLSHDAATQYHEVGSFHPSLRELQPGDLIFWSRDGTVRGIGHVAVYVGDGQVVQAPRSGWNITTSPLYEVERAYMGATRPLT